MHTPILQRKQTRRKKTKLNAIGKKYKIIFIGSIKLILATKRNL